MTAVAVLMIIRSMKLSEWARQQGISYLTAWRWFRAGKLPVPAPQLPSGTILVDVPQPQGRTVLYARVSSHDQRDDLERQVRRLREYAERQGWADAEVVTEIGSGLNGKRKKLLKLLRSPAVARIVVEHRHRLAPFGFEMVEAALASAGKQVLVVEDGEVTDDLVRDLLEILTLACGRLYGRRSARHRARRAVEVLLACESGFPV